MITSFRILGLAVPPIALALGMSLAAGPRPAALPGLRPGPALPIVHGASQHAAVPPERMARGAALTVPGVLWASNRPVTRSVPSPVERAALGPALAY